MNETLIKFCEVEKSALEIYKDGYKPKNEVYDILQSKFKRGYNHVLLIGLEAAAESYNYHRDVGPWFLELREKVGFFTREELKSTRLQVRKKDSEIII